MLDFQPAVRVTQSDDCKYLIFTDSSNYTDNTQGITPDQIVSRSVAIYDADNVLLETISLVLDADSGEYIGQHVITKDIYTSSQLSFIGPGPVTYTGIDNYTSIGFYNKAFTAAMNTNGCSCDTPDAACSDITWSQNNKRASVIFGSRGFGALSQTLIDRANTMVLPQSNC